MITICIIAVFFAGFPALLYLRNQKLFREPQATPRSERPQISVLIPARNEARSIREAVEQILASKDVELEVIVLDDHSTDETFAIVEELSKHDSRVQIHKAPELPAGWCGKQHACFVLAGLARYPLITFLDADVRLKPDALIRMIGFLSESKASLVSGFPYQETGTFLEKLLIPLINWLLLCYLPLAPMRRLLIPGLGAGCGQWFLTSKTAYESMGGHATIKESLHDGVTLPRAFRKHGMMTDICDASNLATCRMYRSAGQVWRGLAKNAREGLAAPILIWVWTVLLFAGHLLPWIGLVVGVSEWIGIDFNKYYFPSVTIDHSQNRIFSVISLSTLAIFLSLWPRFHATARFRSSWIGAFLHPLSIALLLLIQWYATFRFWIGKPVGWKGRTPPAL